MANDAMRTVFILGSCVSRDALEIESDAFKIVSYLARTSMASIGMGAVEDSDVRDKVATLPSDFQRRMALNDLDKTTSAIISDTPHDILLLDFVDERFNLVLTGSTLYSLSGELEKSGLDVEGKTLLTPESESFLSLWAMGLERLLSSIDRTKVVLNRTYWAEHNFDGSEASSMGWIKRNNAILQRLYDAAEKSWHLPSIHYPPEIILADPGHRWGKAPYHYTETLYLHAIQELKRLTMNV